MSIKKNLLLLVISILILISSILFIIIYKKETKTQIFHEKNYVLLKKNIRPDKSCYTQGLIFFYRNSNRYLLESCGLYNNSSLSLINYNNQEILYKINLKKSNFAEGIVKINNKIYQLTWRERVILVYSINEDDTLIYESSIEFPIDIKEGWGFSSYSNNQLLLSDGTENLYVLSAISFKIQRKIRVFYKNNPLFLINELQYIGKDMVLVNVYYSKVIYKIDLIKGIVVEEYDLSQLVEYELSLNSRLKRVDIERNGFVLNGIALMDSLNQGSSVNVIVTGKGWENYYEVELM